MSPAIWASALLAAVCVWFATSTYGPVTTPDSAFYFAMARGVLAGEGFVGYDGLPCTLWPPLYPLLLAGLAPVMGPDLLLAARVLGCLLLFGMVGISLAWICRAVSSGVLRLLACLLIGASTTLWVIGAGALSEGLFLFLSLSALFALTRYTESGRLLPLGIAALSAGLAVVTRYVGVVLYPLAALVVLASWINRRAPSRHLGVSSGLAVVSAIPLAAWLWRNATLTGETTGHRAPAMLSLPENAISALDIASQFFLPAALPLSVRIAALALALAAGIGFIGWQAVREKRLAADTWICALFVAAYLAFLLWMSTRTHIDRMDFRLLAPIYVPVCILLLQAVEATRRLQLPRWMFSLAAVAVAVTAVLQVQRAAEWVIRTHGSGPGMYTDAYWAAEPMLQDLRSAGDAVLYSNAPDVISLRLARNAHLLPIRSDVEADAEEAYSGLLEAADAGELLVAWYPEFWRTYTVGPADLDARFKRELVKAFPDAELWRLSRASPAAPPYRPGEGTAVISE